MKTYEEDEVESWCTDCGHRWEGYPRYCGKCSSIFVEWEPKDKSAVVSPPPVGTFVYGYSDCQDLRTQVATLTAERDRLAHDALAILSANGISTPEKGYIEEPYMLALDIKTLARERDELRATVKAQAGAINAAQELESAVAACSQEKYVTKSNRYSNVMVEFIERKGLLFREALRASAGNEGTG